MRLPDKVEIGEPFEVVANVYSSRKTSARVKLYQGEMLNGLGGVRKLELDAGDNEVKFDSVVRVGGEVTYRLKLDDIADDTFAQNNPVKLGQIPARHFADDIVERRFEEGGRPSGDAVRDLGQGITERNLRSDIGERIAGCLACERARARQARSDPAPECGPTRTVP
jgi:hypothetical protein